MNEIPVPVRSWLRRFQRRLTAGLFLEIWPRWAVASLLLAGVTTLVCRQFFAAASDALPWLLLAPACAVVPAAIMCAFRAFRQQQVVALADSLAGGHGLLLALMERRDQAWAASPLLERLSRMSLPRVRPWRALLPVAPALVFLAVALLLPQRVPRHDASALLANQMAADLTATVAELRQQDLITPLEEEKLEEEIERVRRGALERMDAASWEAADALRERLADSLTEKQDALQWAQQSLSRYAAAAQAGAPEVSAAMAASASQELMQALQKLAEIGQLTGAPQELQRLASGGAALPSDPESLRRLAASLSEFLSGQNMRFAEAASLGREFGRFEPSEFPLDFDPSAPDGDGDPGTGGLNRGRADAPLTLGNETLPFDRFKAQSLPPGFVRSPDDWAPLVVLPGAPQESARLSRSMAARTYQDAAGQAAWRRTLAPRHQSAVKKYFEK
jgi:hypothetical protein